MKNKRILFAWNTKWISFGTYEDAKQYALDSRNKGNMVDTEREDVDVFGVIPDGDRFLVIVHQRISGYNPGW